MKLFFNFIKNHKNFNYLEKNKNSIKIKISDKIYFSIEFDQRMSKVLNKKYIIENNDEEIHFEIKNYDRIEKRFFMNVLEELKKEPEYKLKILLNN